MFLAAVILIFFFPAASEMPAAHAQRNAQAQRGARAQRDAQTQRGAQTQRDAQAQRDAQTQRSAQEQRGAQAQRGAQEQRDRQAQSGALARVPAGNVTANPSQSNVEVDGGSVRVEAFKIAGYNYFRLRALAAATDCGVFYDALNDVINIDSSAPYEEAGGGNNGYAPGFPAGGSVSAAPTKSAVFINGAPAKLESYNIGGYNYFKIRDYLSAVDIGVWYDEAADTIHIETDKGYDPDYKGPGAYADLMDLADGQIPLSSIWDESELIGSVWNEDKLIGSVWDEGELIGAPPSPDGGYGRQVSGDSVSIYRLKIADLVNAERAAASLKPLASDAALFWIAQQKSLDMAENVYFEHISPKYGSPEDMLKQNGVKYLEIGENIARGHKTPESAMRDLMESPGHKKNIMRPDYTHLGVGLAYSVKGDPYWTQLFIKKPPG